jgi:hypothetical protein
MPMLLLYTVVEPILVYGDERAAAKQRRFEREHRLEEVRNQAVVRGQTLLAVEEGSGGVGTYRFNINLGILIFKDALSYSSSLCASHRHSESQNLTG